MSISLTERAAERINRLIADRELPEGAGLRLGIKGGGCAGFEYFVDLVDKPDKFDVVSESAGARVFCDQKSMLFLKGTEVDFTVELMRQGFVFHNPNASKECGCGESFSV